MNELQYNDKVVLHYEHVPIIGSGNPMLATKYITKIMLGKYNMGQFDGKLDEEEIKARVAELLHTHQERQYGQQSTAFISRRNLTPVRDRIKR